MEAVNAIGPVIAVAWPELLILTIGIIATVIAIIWLMPRIPGKTGAE